MRKEQVLSRMREECLIAVIRAKNPEQGEKIVEAVIAGGIHFIEITMTMEEGNPVQFISAMAEKYRRSICQLVQPGFAHGKYLGMAH